MSALPPKADIAGRQLDVRFTPKSGHQFGLEGNDPKTLYVIMGRLHITVDVDAISFTPQARQVLYSVRP
jgi:hypothetical protein